MCGCVDGSVVNSTCCEEPWFVALDECSTKISMSLEVY